jgi:hypothetical protein
MASLAILLLLLARFSGSIAISSKSNYSISRSAEQQVIATVAPVIIPDADDGQIAQPFLTSPSGSYAAYLRRVANNADSLGGEACYVQIQKAGGEDSVWESECTPVGGSDACDLAFSPAGLELVAGGDSLWHTGLDSGDPVTLSLDDGGDMSILTKEGATVWKSSGEPWTGQQCGAPVPASKSPSMDSLLPPPMTTSAKLATPSAVTLAGTGSTDSSFGDQLTPPPPVDTVPAPDFPVQPPVDTVPEQPMAPPPADSSTDTSLPPPSGFASPDSPDLPLVPPPPQAQVSPDHPLAPPPADISPDQPRYSSPPPAPAVFGPPAALPPFGVPLAPPAGAGATSRDTPLPGATTPPHAPPHGEPGSPGGVPFSGTGPPPGGLPQKQGPLNHDLPDGASPPLPDTLGPSGHGEGTSGPLGRGQPQQGVFGQDRPLVDGEGHPLPLEDSAGGWSRREHGRVAVGVVLAALIALCFGF